MAGSVLCQFTLSHLLASNCEPRVAYDLAGSFQHVATGAVQAIAAVTAKRVQFAHGAPRS